MICSPIGRRPSALARTGWTPGLQACGNPSFSSDSKVRNGRPTARKTAGLRSAHHAASGGQSMTNLRNIRTVPVCTVDDVTDAIEQAQYQVRFDWGVDGARAIGGGADVLVFVDVLGESHVDVDVDSLTATAGVVVGGSLRNAAAVARWALDAQADKGDRFTIAIVAVGETRESGRIRFALEDLLGAGAIIDALASAGIDYCSPEAAAAAAAYTGLRNATRHLIGASTSGREAAARGYRAAVDAALESNSSDEVTVLREFSTGA
jgi:2-phosphosulfolactate phosphatase